MQSQKKLKIPSLLSLPSLPTLNINKKSLLKPLQLSDIIVAMVQEQTSVDKTKQLKSYLTKNRKKTINLDQDQQLIYSPMNDLPQFAKKQWGFSQLLKYHIQKKKANPFQQIKKWQIKLSQIQNLFSNSLQKYKYELQQGKNSIEQIQVNINNLYERTLVSKQHVKKTKERIKEFSKKIVINARKQQNILKTIAIAKAWSKSKISKILSVDVNMIQNINIRQILKQIQNCQKQIKLQGLNKELQNYDKVLKILQQRRNIIIERVQKNMLNSIIQYKDIEKYNKIYQQYNDLLNNLSWSNTQKYKQYHQLQQNNILSMIQQNIDFIYWNSLQSVSTINNIQILRQQTYIQFIHKLIDNYNNYIIKWHKVTSYHVNNNTQHKDTLMNMLSQVINKIIKKTHYLIKLSHKFYSLSFSYKIKIILQVNKLVEFIHEWSNKNDQSLFQILKQKFNNEIDNYRKQTNGLIKVLFVQEFSQQGLMPKIKRKPSNDMQKQYNSNQIQNNSNRKQQSKPIEDNMYRKVNDMIDEQETQKMKQKQKVKQLQKLKQICKNKLFPQNFNRLNNNNNINGSSSPLKSTSYTINQSHSSNKQSQTNYFLKLKDKIKQLTQQNIDLQISKTFIKSITQYCERQQILPFGHLSYILQHFQFIILLIFKVCVHDQTKTKIIQDFTDKPFLKLKQIQNTIDKNTHDQNTINHLTKMRQSFIMRRNYLQFHYYMSQQIDNKFDNLVISGFLNINKLYQNPQQNIQFLNSYHIKLSKLIQQLLKISRWLINNQSFFINYSQYTKKLQLLPTVLIQLSFLYFQQYNSILYNKYLEKIQPLMKSLKWKIQKFNQQTTQHFRQYKINILQIYRSSTLNIGIKDKELYQQLTNKHLQVFYKALLYLYCKIDKINDNGRQVLRLDVIQISKILQQVGYNPGSWAVWFEKFIESTMQRSIKSILQKIEQLGIVYPIYCWKSPLLWIVNNLSTKQKKQYTNHLLKIYVDQLKQLPQL